MICPNCGCEMQEDHLYCEKCGMEIRIVPDFEPEIENSIIETLSTVAEEIEGKKPEDKEVPQPEQGEEKKPEDEIQEEFFTEVQGKNRMLMSVVIFSAAALVLTVFALFMYHRFSVSYQVDTARKYADSGKYKEAVSYLDKARELESENAEIALLQSSYYYLMGESQQAIDLLKDLIVTTHLSYENEEKAYERIIAILNEEERYTEINDLLLACPNEEIVTLFQNYLAMEPEFSYTGGSYDEIVPLKLSANTTGKIYYTLDGSTPTENSAVYTAPIFLESGVYQVTAFFVNDYGIESKTVRNWYEINLTIPDAPEVLLYSGTYHIPTKIEIALPGTGSIYYTTDGSEPNINSLLYTEPIDIPLGRSNFKFAVISEEGVSSETISRSYEFKLETDITTDKAVNRIMEALVNREVLIDMQGNAQGVKGKYRFQYSSIVELNETYYYILNEYFRDQNGNETKTEHLYAVEVYTGAPNRLIYDENGEMGLISLQ